MRLGLRYDMRSPAVGVVGSRLWQAVVDQCVWADGLGAETVLLGEHHGDVDGYNPSPMLLAAAILGSTERISVHLSALVAPLHDPVRLAERTGEHLTEPHQLEIRQRILAARCVSTIRH